MLPAWSAKLRIARTLTLLRLPEPLQLVKTVAV